MWRFIGYNSSSTHIICILETVCALSRQSWVWRKNLHIHPWLLFLDVSVMNHWNFLCEWPKSQTLAWFSGFSEASHSCFFSKASFTPGSSYICISGRCDFNYVPPHRTSWLEWGLLMLCLGWPQTMIFSTYAFKIQCSELCDPMLGPLILHFWKPWVCSSTVSLSTYLFVCSILLVFF